jgi:hypothetical protein
MNFTAQMLRTALSKGLTRLSAFLQVKKEAGSHSEKKNHIERDGRDVQR